MALYVSARVGRQLAAAVTADALPANVRAVRSISGALVIGPAGSLPTIRRHVRFYAVKASENGKLTAAKDTDDEAVISENITVTTPLPEHGKLTAAKDTEDEAVISENITVTFQPQPVPENDVPKSQTEVDSALTSSPVLANGISANVRAVRAVSGSMPSFRSRESGNYVRFFSEKPLGSRLSDDAPTGGAPANLPPSVGAPASIPASGGAPASIPASGGALIIWQGSSAGTKDTSDAENLKKELQKEEIRLNRIRVVQSVLYSNLMLREAAVSKMEHLQKEDSVVTGLEFVVDGLRLTVADLPVKKEDLNKVFKAQQVGQRYIRGFEDVKSVIKEAFQSLSEPDKQVMSTQLQKALSESFSSLPQEEKVLVASEVRKLLKATGFDSSDESGSTKGPFEWLFGKLGLDKEIIVFLVLAFLIWFEMSGDVQMARELIIGFARYGFPGLFKVWDEAYDRAHPGPNKTVTVEILFDIGNVKVKLADSELTVAGLEALIDSQKTDLKDEVAATGRLCGFFSGISSWIGGLFSSPSKKTKD